jgi:hypothetical protein
MAEALARLELFDTQFSHLTSDGVIASNNDHRSR